MNKIKISFTLHILDCQRVISPSHVSLLKLNNLRRECPCVVVATGCKSDI